MTTQSERTDENEQAQARKPEEEKRLVTLQKKLRQLRQRHTDLANAGKWQEAQTSQRKIIEHLNQICREFPDWHEMAFADIDRPELQPQAQPPEQGEPIITPDERILPDGRVIDIEGQEPAKPSGEHSALPWHSQFNTIRADGSPAPVADCYDSNFSGEANAKLIVASVNHAQALADALRDVLAEFQESDNDAPYLKVTLRAKQALAAWKEAQS